ncbi:MAG: hypothetical protein KJO02_01295 [Erythrobacter sp.]|nr:hypothetical protein [Erythrobacter sp.]
MNHAVWLGLASIIPLVVGPLPEADDVLSAKLCNGGTIEIPLKKKQPSEQPCAAKGCHAGSCRKRIDLAQ